MKKLTNSNKIVHLVDLYRNKKSQELALATEMRLYRLHLELIEWIDDIGHDTDAVRDRYTVSVMRIIKDICDRGKLTPTISTYLAHVFTCLGFPDYAASALSVGTTEDRALSFEFIKVVKSKGKTPLYKFMHITEHPTVWQLRLFGEFMDRSMDGKPDPRVAFVPDAWQREVLDCIDEDGSLLVVG